MMEDNKKKDQSESTFFYEGSLPKLPLPDLDETLSQLKKSLEPLYYADGYYKHPLDQEQLNILSDSLSTFLDSKTAQKLQEKLIQFDNEYDCYLDKLHLDINNHTSTTDVADDVLPRNPFLVLADDAIPGILQVDHAAVLVHSALRFVSALKQNLLPPDFTVKAKRPLAMQPYLNLFGTTRCPVFEKGEVERFNLNKPYTASDLESDEWSDAEDEIPLTKSPLSFSPVPSNSNLEFTNSKLRNGDIGSSPSTREGSISHENDVFTRNGISFKRSPNSKHLLVISKGQYYTVPVLDDDNNGIYSDVELSTIFTHILADSNEIKTFKESTALGSLTSHSYKNWRYARKRLEKRYPEELNSIDSALFVLVLDDSSGVDNPTFEEKNTLDEPICKTSEDCKRLFYGTSIIDERGHQVGSCISRWYDKLQLVVTADSKAAVIWDSFTCDGSVVLRFISETYTESILRLARDVHENKSEFSLWPKICDPSTKPSGGLHNIQMDPSIAVQKIDWAFSNILDTHVHLSETKLADLISKYDISYVSVPFGRRYAQRLGVNPDAMVQVAIQVAHYALYGRMVYGYEPISTRGFKNSRSSFINLQNQNLLELCQVFISNSLDGIGKLDKFIQACQLHSIKVKTAKTGNSFERHFNALKYLYKFHEHFGLRFDAEDKTIAANVFENPLVAPFSSPELIVANCGNSATTTFGITPAIPQGFGIGYIIKDDQCDLTVTSQFRQGNRLMFMLNWVLNEIRDYLRDSREFDQNRTGIKISPLVDRLYEMDNAINALKIRNTSASHLSENGYGFFDLKAHMDSRTVSVFSSKNNSNSSLKQLDRSISNGGMTISKILASSTFVVPTDKEKQDTGHQIFQLQPTHLDDSDEEDGLNTRPETKRVNVINSKFEINFDRGRVGRKVTTFE